MTIDRVAPTKRPDRTPAGTQSWRRLLFVHWAVSVDVMRPLVPASLELDLWEGQALVGLVPFEMKRIRSAWMPARAGLDFLETNLRTYVHHAGEPGVYFFSLEASSWLAVRAARWVWGLPYFHATMESEARDGHHRYRSTRKRGGALLATEFTRGEHLGASQPGTYEHFILERYLLFSERRGKLRKGQVHHTPYPAERVTLDSFEQTILDAAGFTGAGAPMSAHYAEGVDVEVFGPWTVM